MISLPPNKGKLLVAEPSIIGDVSFNRSVVLLADHNAEGSVGFILNKVLDHSLSELVPGVNKDFKIYNGGPVEQDNLYFIHKVPDLIPGSIEIDGGIFWGGNFEVVKSLIENNLIFEDDIKFFLGYSGWDSNQLNVELDANAWVVIENKDNKGILQQDATNFWKDKMEELGGDYLIWSNSPENPSYN